MVAREELSVDEKGQPAEWESNGIAEAVSDRLFAFGEDLRITWANRSFRSALANGASPVGLTLGDVLVCRHAGPGRGCGGAETCGACGWFQAATADLQGRAAGPSECRILTRSGAAFDFGVTVLAADAAGGRPWRLCALQDLFAAKRLRVLERTFFHDVTNLAVGVRGLCELMAGAPAGADPEMTQLLCGSAEKLMDEIQRLRVLRMAENGDLAVTATAFEAGELMRTVAARYADEASARRVEVMVDDGLAGAPVTSDRDVLHVVLCDLLQNALEAAARSDRIALSCAPVAGGGVVFRVANPAVLPDEVRAHVFERSFTTRGSGKGVGAYRAKLLCERYLEGRLSWTSQPSEGTVFALELGGAARGGSE